MGLFQKTKYWRINVGAGQISAEGCAGADEYRDRLFSKSDLPDIKLKPESGDKLENQKIAPGSKVVLSGVGVVGAKTEAAVQHRAIATGTLEDFRFDRYGRAVLTFREITPLRSKAASRTLEAPMVKSNVHEIAAKEWKRLSAVTQ